LVCFSIRTIILPLTYYISDGKFQWPTILIYILCSELLPLFLMLQVFDPLSNPAMHEDPEPNNKMFGLSQMSQRGSFVQNNLNPGDHIVSKNMEYYPTTGSQGGKRSARYEEEDFDYTTLPEYSSSASYTTINPLNSPMNTPKKNTPKPSSSHRFSTTSTPKKEEEQQQRQQKQSLHSSKLVKSRVLNIGSVSHGPDITIDDPESSVNRGPDIIIDDTIDPSSSSYQPLNVPLLRDNSTFTNDVLHVLEQSKN